MWLHSKWTEEIAQSKSREHSLRAVPACNVSVAQIKCCNRLDRATAAHVEEFRGRENFYEIFFAGQSWKRDANAHNPARLGIGKRVQHDAIDKGEDHHVAAD